MLSSYGLLRGMSRLVMLALLDRTSEPGELVMDGIAVDPAYRSAGIGGLLLAESATIAAEHGCCMSGTASPPYVASRPVPQGSHGV
ncbi:GNAT family N-acetyltransferase [Streptomyces lasalocidi]|uniref:GNAT family N-acetyltransferase n=1 Tax=Streptomyces lasalocidi TaxID=324833 RepID=UPI0030C8B63F